MTKRTVSTGKRAQVARLRRSRRNRIIKRALTTRGRCNLGDAAVRACGEALQANPQLALQTLRLGGGSDGSLGLAGGGSGGEGGGGGVGGLLGGGGRPLGVTLGGGGGGGGRLSGAAALAGFLAVARGPLLDIDLSCDGMGGGNLGLLCEVSR